MRPIAEQGNVEAELVGECCRGKWSIDADAQNLGIGLRQLILELAEA
jgi:hypothetical protein